MYVNIKINNMDKQIKEYREKQKEKYNKVIVSSTKCRKKNIKVAINKSKYSSDSSDSSDIEDDYLIDKHKIPKQTNKKSKKTIPSTVKRLVWNKYIGENIGKYKCYCCKLTEITQLSFHCGHVISEKNGGKINIDNLRPICQNCNSSMGTKNMNDFITEYSIHK